MKSAAENMREKINNTSFNKPTIKIVSNVTAEPVNDQNQIQPCDVMQMTNGTANYRVRELPNDTYTEIFACTTLEDRLSFSDQGICGLAELEGQYLNNIVINGSNVNDINFNINPNLSF